MKHTHNQMRFAAAAAMLLFAATGCLKENFYDPAGTSYGPTITASIDEASEDGLETRVSISEETLPTTGKIYYYWTPEDQIGVFTDASESNVCYKNTESSKVKTATFAPASRVTGTPVYAYYPYSAEAGTDITAVKGQIPSQQIINAALDNVPGIYRYGYYKSTSGNSSSFGFKHVMSTVRFHIEVAGTPLEGRKLHNLQISVKRGNVGVPVCGDFTFSAESGEHKEIKSSTSNTINVAFEGTPVLNSGITFYTTMLPNVQKGDVLYFTLNASGYTATYRVSTSLNFKKNYVYTISTTIKSYNTLKVVENEIDKPAPSELPTINEFKFEVTNNSGKILNNELKWDSSKHTPSFTTVSSHKASINNDTEEITLTIPYLYDFKLKPTFSVGSDCVVTANGVEQKSGETEVDFSRTVTYTVKNKTNGYSRDYKVKITNTGLPVVVVEHSTSGSFTKKYNGGFNIGSTNIGGTLVNQFVDFMIRGKDTDWVTNDHITIYNADGTIDCEVDGGARLRGNTSQVYPKKPLALKFNDKKSVLGMPAHKRWVLLANWLDHSMIRNAVAFDIANVIEYAWRDSGGAIGDGIPWNVHGQNVELIVVDKDGDAHHVGNYLLCEQIKIDGNRLNITKTDGAESGSDYSQYGYLFEIDGNYDETSKFRTSNKLPFMFKDQVSTTILNNVQKKVQRIEDNIDNGNYDAAFNELDVNSVVDQFLIWELAMNREYGDPRSVYMFMDGDGKLCAGPVWDFDRGTFQNQEKAEDLGNTTSYRIKPDNEWMCWRTQEEKENDNGSAAAYIWYKQLIESSKFQETVKARWAVIKPYLDIIPDRIRYYGETQAVSYKYDSAMWPTNTGDVKKYKSDFKDWSGDEELGQNGNYQEVIDNFVTVYNERLAGMDALITSGKFTK